MVVNTNIPPKHGHSGRLQLLQLEYNSCKRTSDARLTAHWPLHAACRDTILVKAKTDRDFAAKIFNKYPKCSYNSCKRISEVRMRAVFSVQLPHAQIQYL